MAIRIEAYTEDKVPEVREFNRRLHHGGVPFQFPEEHFSHRFPRTEGIGVYQEYFLALDGDRVCGGYILKHQTYNITGRSVAGAFYRLPISEGTIDRRYAPVALRLIRDAVSKQPLLFGVGMGGLETPVAKLLAVMRWGLHLVPFYFRIVRPSRFLKGARHLRKTRARRIALDLLAASGMGWIGVKVVQWRPGRGGERNLGANLVDSFGPWADQLWQDHRERYLAVASRDAATLNVLYPPGDSRFLRLQVMDSARVVGWALLLDTRMSDNQYFGDLRVGSIADAFSAPDDAPLVIGAATRLLEERGVDLILSNQCHVSWCLALKRRGYIQGPSNFALGVSPKLLELLEPFERNWQQVHLTRGDGDGPIHL